jgi:hypothetical protein
MIIFIGGYIVFLEKWYRTIRVAWGILSFVLKMVMIGWEVNIITNVKIQGLRLDLYNTKRAILAAVLIIVLDILVTIVLKHVVTNILRNYRFNQYRLITSTLYLK